MNIRILHLIDGARAARGLTVIIDVFRAFSTACYVFGNGAEKILPVGDLEAAYQLKKQHPSFVLIGERGGMKPEGFDYGNSPTHIETVDFTGQTVIQTTSAGTQGIANAHQADEIITGSFCNAGAIIAYIRAKQPQQVSFVGMGDRALTPSEEDTACAQFLKDSLEGKSPDFADIRAKLRACLAAQKFFDPEKTWAPERDFELCLTLSRFDFILQVQPDENGLHTLRKIHA